MLMLMYVDHFAINDYEYEFQAFDGLSTFLREPCMIKFIWKKSFYKVLFLTGQPFNPPILRLFGTAIKKKLFLRLLKVL